MRLRPPLTLLSLVFLYLLLVAVPSFGHSYHRILLLHSYHAGYKWTDDITRGAQEILNRKSGYDLRIEYLDTKRFTSLAYLDFQREVLERKYPDNPFEVILCADNNSLRFILRHRQTLFPDTPVVFCGINGFSPEMLQGKEGITGVVEDIAPRKTVDLMLTLHPKATRIVVINDGTVTGKAVTNQLIEVSKGYPGVGWYFPFIYTLEQLTILVDSLQPGDLILLGSFSRDFNGNLIEYDEVGSLVSNNAQVPTYTLWDFYMGTGVLGGYLASGIYQGKKSGEMVRQIIEGTPVSELPVVRSSPNHYFIDYTVLKSYQLDTGKLPEDATVINQPPDFYGQNKGLIWSSVLVLIALSLLSFFLSIAVFRRKRAENSLRQLTDELEDRVARRTADLSRANEAIKEWQEQMQLLISNLPGMVYRCRYDELWTMLFVSEGVTALTGYRPQEIIGNRDTSYAALIDPRDNESINREVAAAVEERRHFRLEYRIRTKSGELRWVWEQGLAVYDPDGKVKHLDGFITDITKRKRFELEQTKLAAAVNQAEEMVIITDLDGTIEYANPASETITGYSGEELLGENPRLLKSGKQPDSFYREMWNSLLAGEIYRGRIVNRRKNGEDYVADIAISPIRNDQGELTNFVGVQRDISHQLNLERNLQQAQKLEAMGTLAGGIAHEINTPAQFVTTNLDFLVDSMPDLTEFIDRCLECLEIEDSDRQQCLKKLKELKEENDLEFLLEEIPQALQQSLDGIKQIARIVLSMKQFAHPGEEGKSYANLNEALHNTATVCRNEWKYVAELEFDLDPDLPLVPCHQSELNQVFLNIIVNAAHAIESHHPGEEIVGRIRITTRSRGDMVEILIADNGGGIPDAIRERVFDPFFTTKEVGRGTGQGLAIAHRIVTEKHHGELFFDSQPGEGTSFTIRLPLSDATTNGPD